MKLKEITIQKKDIFDNVVPYVNVSNLVPGITAYIRLKDEGETLESSLKSILGLFDHYVVIIQPSTDETVDIVKNVFENYPCTLVHYPVNSWPNGPGYDKQDELSFKSRTYFYNYGCQFIPTTHAMKWDGDMVASNGLIDILKQWKNIKKDYVIMKGVECADGCCSLVNDRVYTGSEIRIFKLREKNFTNGNQCELLSVYKDNFVKKIVRKLSTLTVNDACYYHFKYAKLESSRSKAWPENWEELDHFRNLANYKVIKNSTCLLELTETVLRNEK